MKCNLDGVGRDVRAAALPWVLSVAAMGCANRFETRPYDPVHDRTAIAGLRYFEPRLYEVRYELTALTDRTGGVLGSAADGSCRRAVQKEDLVVLPDFEHPRVILHHPSWLASGRLSVTLSDGVLTAVNAESAPVTADVLTLLQKSAQLALAATPDAVPACNANPEIARIRPANLQE